MPTAVLTERALPANMLPILVASVAVMLASLAGVLFVWGRAGAYVERNLDFLVSFSAGVFLVFAYQLSNEALEHAGPLWYGLLWIFGGALGIWLAFKLLPRLHQHEEHGSHSRLDARRLLLTDAVHNTADGIFLAASFAVGGAVGLAAAISIFVHEFLQEVSEFFVLRDAGYSIQKALSLNFVVSSSVLVGAIGGYFLLETFTRLEGPLLGIAAGGILVVVLHDLVPHSVRESLRTAHYVAHLLWFAAGLGLMLVVLMALGHE